jgi:hypothetical protein
MIVELYAPQLSDCNQVGGSARLAFAHTQRPPNTALLRESARYHTISMYVVQAIYHTDCLRPAMCVSRAWRMCKFAPFFCWRELGLIELNQHYVALRDNVDVTQSERPVSDSRVRSSAHAAPPPMCARCTACGVVARRQQLLYSRRRRYSIYIQVAATRLWHP